MDLAEQLSAVWARRVAVLAAALVVAAAVFVWRAAAPETYEASAILQVRLPDTDASDPSTRADYYAETVVGLMTSRDVVADALGSAGREEEKPSAVADRLTVQTGTQPGFVEVTADGRSGRQAADLANALVAAVDRRVTAEQTADIDAERNRLTAALQQVLDQLYSSADGDSAAKAALIREREELISALRTNAARGTYRVATVESAVPPAHPVAPTPLRDALLAFLVALVVVAEGIVIRRAWRGAISARDPAGDVAATIDAPAVALRSVDGVESVAPLLPAFAESPRITVACVGRRRPDGRAAVLVARLLAARGRDVLLVDATSRRPSVHRALGVDLVPGLSEAPTDRQALRRHLRGLPRVTGFRALTAGRPGAADAESRCGPLARVLEAAGDDCVVVAVAGRRLDELLALMPEYYGSVIVVVDSATATRRSVRQLVAAWRGLGVTLVGAVVTVRNAP